MTTDAIRVVTLEIIQDARSLSPSAFCVKHPYPFLLGDERSTTAAEGDERKLGGETSFMTTALPPGYDHGPEPLAMAPSIIVPVRKGPQNPFASMVTVGRASNNDLQLEAGTISKFHAYFHQIEGRWRLTDGRSQNGTFVQGERLPDGGDRNLSDGDAVAFGPDSRFRFFDGRTLYHMIRGFVEPGKPAT
jgi:hypothetical protein